MVTLRLVVVRAVDAASVIPERGKAATLVDKRQNDWMP